MNERLTVLHLIPTMEGGGAERQLAYLAQALAGAGVRVHIVLLRSGTNMARLERAGVTVHMVPYLRNSDPRILRRLVGIIGTIRPHIIQSWITQMDVLGGIAAWWTRTPFVMTERASALAYGSGWKDWLRRHLGKRASMIVANSETGARYWVAALGPDRVRVIRNAIPLREIAACAPAARPSIKLSENAELILYLGRYAPQKNLDLLLDSLARVLSRRPAAVAILHGEGPHAHRLGEAAARLAPDGRIRVGAYAEDAWSLMKTAAVFVSISLFEGMPNTVLEAAACGCPLVLSDIPEHRELFDEQSAWLVRSDSGEAVVQAIVAALHDRAEAQRKARRALDIVSRFSVEESTKQYLRLYQGIVGPGL